MKIKTVKKPFKEDNKIKQCCSCERVFKKFKNKKEGGNYGLCPSCFSGNWVYGYIDENKDISNDNNTPCEKCLKILPSVRFEGSEEGFFCDECLYELMKGGLKE